MVHTVTRRFTPRVEDLVGAGSNGTHPQCRPAATMYG